MSDKKVIAIVGATGAQGAGLARAILREGDKGEFAVRAITRNVNSEKANELAKLGAEVVSADINDEASITKAVEGAYGMYCVTLYSWKGYKPETETIQATNMSKAARNAGVKHVVWSTTEDSRLKVPLESKSMPTLLGKYKVPYCDVKGEADKLFADLPTTYLLTSFFWENFIDLHLGPAKYYGSYYLSLPIGKKRLNGIGTEDIGKCALGIFKHPQDYINKRVGIVGEGLTLVQMSEKMSTALGKKIAPYEISFKEFRDLGFEGAADFANMFQYMHDFEEDICAVRSVDESKKLNPELMNFDQWLAANKQRIPME